MYVLGLEHEGERNAGQAGLGSFSEGEMEGLLLNLKRFNGWICNQSAVSLGREAISKSFVDLKTEFDVASKNLKKLNYQLNHQNSKYSSYYNNTFEYESKTLQEGTTTFTPYTQPYTLQESTSQPPPSYSPAETSSLNPYSLSYSQDITHQDHSFEETNETDDEQETDNFTGLTAILRIKQIHQTFQGMDEDAKDQQLMDIINISSNFTSSARTYALMIIGERHFKHNKMIEAIDAGGIAGGTKFVVNDLFFKYPTDTEIGKNKWLYGGVKADDDLAAKASNHDLIGSTFCFNADTKSHFYFPLLALIDYQGFRITAISCLPIQLASTLVYGSKDGGKTVHCDPEMSEIMKGIAENLHLQPHLVTNTNVTMALCTDIEIHKIDDKYFMLDLARVFPPTCSRFKDRGSYIFYQMFRPELLQKFKKEGTIPPLSSDGLSSFQHVSESESLDLSITSATQVLFDTIEDLAKEIVDNNCDIILNHQRYSEMSIGDPIFDSVVAKDFFLIYLHSKGINTRYLGLLTFRIFQLLEERSNNHNQIRFLIQLVIARATKNLWKSEMRKTTSSVHVTCQSVSNVYINNLLRLSKQSVFLDRILEIVRRMFGNYILDQKEQRILIDLISEYIPQLDLNWIIVRFSQITGIVLGKTFIKCLKNKEELNNLIFTQADIQNFLPIVKTAPILDYYTGLYYFKKAKNKELSIFSRTNLFQTAQRHLERALGFNFKKIRNYYCYTQIESVLLNKKTPINWQFLIESMYEIWKDNKSKLKETFYFVVSFYWPLLHFYNDNPTSSVNYPTHFFPPLGEVPVPSSKISRKTPIQDRIVEFLNFKYPNSTEFKIQRFSKSNLAQLKIHIKDFDSLVEENWFLSTWFDFEVYFEMYKKPSFDLWDYQSPSINYEEKENDHFNDETTIFFINYLKCIPVNAQNMVYVFEHLQLCISNGDQPNIDIIDKWLWINLKPDLLVSLVENETISNGVKYHLAFRNKYEMDLKDNLQLQNPNSDSLIFSKFHHRYKDNSHNSEDFPKMLQFLKNFSTEAVSLGSLILKQNNNIIQPVNVGGIAGGEKYVLFNYFFKLPKRMVVAPKNVDTLLSDYTPYGAVEPVGPQVPKVELDYEYKICNHEIIGSTYTFNSARDSLNFPIVGFVSLNGQKILVLSKLMLSPTTLIYGSSDAGKTYYFDEKVHKDLCAIAKQFHIQPHLLAKSEMETALCCDIEVHKLVDNELFVLDVSRVFPPTHARTSQNMDILYQLFRPELLQKLKLMKEPPLSSDGLSNFQNPKERELLNANIQRATQILFKKIEELATELAQDKEILNTFWKHSRSSMFIDKNREAKYSRCPKEPFLAYLNFKGINTRYLGLLTLKLFETNSGISLWNHPVEIILLRSFKNYANKNRINNPSAAFLNEIVKVESNNPILPTIAATFGSSETNHILSGSEMEVLKYIVKQPVDLSWLLNRFCQITGIVPGEKADEISHSTVFKETDIVGVNSIIKLPMLDYYNGKDALQKARNPGPSKEEAHNLYKVSQYHFMRVLGFNFPNIRRDLCASQLEEIVMMEPTNYETSHSSNWYFLLELLHETWMDNPLDSEVTFYYLTGLQLCYLSKCTTLPKLLHIPVDPHFKPECTTQDKYDQWLLSNFSKLAQCPYNRISINQINQFYLFQQLSRVDEYEWIISSLLDFKDYFELDTITNKFKKWNLISIGDGRAVAYFIEHYLSNQKNISKTFLVEVLAKLKDNGSFDLLREAINETLLKYLPEKELYLLFGDDINVIGSLDHIQYRERKLNVNLWENRFSQPKLINPKGRIDNEKLFYIISDSINQFKLNEIYNPEEEIHHLIELFHHQIYKFSTRVINKNNFSPKKTIVKKGGLLFEMGFDEYINKPKANYLLGGDEPSLYIAGKTGHRHILALTYFLNADRESKFTLPFYSIIDFRGVRISANSCLEINSDTPTLFGYDKKRTTYHYDQQTFEYLKHIADQLHLQTHLLPDQTFSVPICGNVKIYKVNNKLIVNDLEMLFPPVFYTKTVYRVAYQKFRPEMLQILKKTSNPPLCSDAFSSNQDIKEGSEWNVHIAVATDFLYQQIEDLAKEIVSNNCDILLSHQRYSEMSIGDPILNGVDSVVAKDFFLIYLHSKGINTRYLGLLTLKIFQILEEKPAHIIFLIQLMIVRAIKFLWRDETGNREQVTPHEPTKAIQYLNNIINLSPHFVEDISKAIDQMFGHFDALDTEKLIELINNVITSISNEMKKWIILRFLKISGIVLSKTKLEELNNANNLQNTIFSEDDFVEFIPVMKTTPILGYYCGLYYYQKAKNKQLSIIERTNLYQTAKIHLENSLEFNFTKIRQYYCHVNIEFSMLHKATPVMWSYVIGSMYHIWQEDKQHLQNLIMFIISFYWPILAFPDIQNYHYPVLDCIPYKLVSDGDIQRRIDHFIKSRYPSISYADIDINTFPEDLTLPPKEEWDLPSAEKGWLSSLLHLVEDPHQ